MSKKGLYGQHIANAFPLWSDIRTDEQSMGRQLLNPIGNIMDEMYQQLQQISDNNYISTARISDIDVYYYVRLPKTFEFEKEDGDDTEWFFTPPSVSGLVNGTYNRVTISDKNDVESFWYTSLPSRVSLETTVSGSCLLASGQLNDSPIPLAIPSGVIDVPNKLYVTVSGGFAYINTDEANYTSQTIVQIDGVSRAGADIVEELSYAHAATLQTRNEFQQVHEVRCYFTPYNTTATIQVDTAAFNMVDYPAAYQFQTNEYKEDVLTFWGIGDGPLTGQRTLNVRKYDTDEILNRLGGYTDRHDFISFELLDDDGNYIAAQDLAIEPHADRVWVVSSGTLYLYDSDLYYPETKTMTGRNYDAGSIVEPSTYHLIPGETIRLYYVWKRPLSEIQRYRIWVIKPDGTKKSIIDGVEDTYRTGASSWQGGPLMINRNIQAPDEFVLTDSGQYTYCLEVGYVNGTSSVDKKIVTVQSKRPRASFPIAEATGDWKPIIGIDIDSEYKIWLRNIDGQRYQINLHYDNMIIDWNRKIIYFREPYEQVRVFDYTE